MWGLNTRECLAQYRAGRLAEAERHRLAALAGVPPVYAPLLVFAGRWLIAIGQRLAAFDRLTIAPPERQHTAGQPELI